MVDKLTDYWNVNLIHWKDNELFNFKNYMKLERGKRKVEINLGSGIVKYFYLMNNNVCPWFVFNYFI